jgi:hypothetical protein
MVVTITGEVSTTAQVPFVFGEGPWLLQSHSHTLAANHDYNTTALPAALSTAVYPYDDREEQIARAFLQGIAQFFGRTHLRPAAQALRLLHADPVVSVAPGAPLPSTP